MNAESIWHEGTRPPARLNAENNEQTLRLEDALRQSERHALIGRLTASVMHEISNPAEAISNLVYLIAQNPYDPEVVRTLAGQIEEQLIRIQYVTRQTLSYFRETPQKQPVDLVKLIENAIRFYEPSLKRKHIDLRTQLPQKLTALVYSGDFLQLVSNLVSNAIDAVTEGGSLCIRLRPLGNTVRLTVADNGCGIPPALRPRLFEAFQTSKAEIGNGLGLWICNSVVQKHGGRISWRSSRDGGTRGTTFAVTLAS